MITSYVSIVNTSLSLFSISIISSPSNATLLIPFINRSPQLSLHKYSQRLERTVSKGSSLADEKRVKRMNRRDRSLEGRI